MTLPLHPLAGSSFINWLKLLQANKRIDRQYLLKAILISIGSAAGIPNRFYEKAICDRKINELAIKSPIFIVGHWRSGTTYLHNLITQDSNLGYVSSLQAWCPELFLGSQPIIQFILKNFLPENRPMDNIKLSGELPQEEEYALGNVSLCCFYHGWYFPQQMLDYFQQLLSFENSSEEIQQEWQNAYLRVLKKATLKMDGKRLVIKNPANTARIRTLLKMFPDAKFIHIYRNPYVVFLSTKHLYRQLLPILSLQKISDREIEKNILLIYRKMMLKFFKDKSLIPQANLFEINYEDFIANPSDTLATIYQKFNLTGFENNEKYFNRYIVTQKSYQSNQYQLTEEDKNKVLKHWNFALKEWNYKSLNNINFQKSCSDLV